MTSLTPLKSPRHDALRGAALYVAIGILYILLSSTLALDRAIDARWLAHIELLKGCAYVLFTGALLYGGMRWILTRYQHQTHALAQSQQALLASEQRAQAALLASSVAHDLNNLLMVIASNVELLRLEPSPSPDASAALDDIGVALARGESLARRLGGVAQVVARCEPVALLTLVQECLMLVSGHHRVRGCQLMLSTQTEVQLNACEGLLHQALINLIFNAADAMDGQGIIELRLVPQADGVWLEVHDEGPGIPIAERAAIFEPFYTTKATGVGLGMISVRASAQAHGGRVEIADSPRGGALVRLWLPHQRYA